MGELLLFVALAPGRRRSTTTCAPPSCAALRTELSPRHVPDAILAVPGGAAHAVGQEARGAGEAHPRRRRRRRRRQPQLARRPDGARLVRGVRRVALTHRPGPGVCTLLRGSERGNHEQGAPDRGLVPRPGGDHTLRYWDGDTWTARVRNDSVGLRPASAVEPPATAERPTPGRSARARPRRGPEPFAVVVVVGAALMVGRRGAAVA